MKQQIKRPNIFKISTKELSQDAFITWLLQWANPECATLDIVLHECGRDFLSLVMDNEAENAKTIKYVEAGRQWENIDVWAEIFFTDETKTLLVIEDKTFSGEHSNQLARYKKQAEDYCKEQAFNTLLCTYFKIGSEPLRAIEGIKEKGFNIITREQIRTCLQSYRNTEHSILKDFIEYIDDLEAAHSAFETLPPKDWRDLAWVGFYQFVEANLKIITWHWVHNPNGGFWNLCLTWKYWNECIPVYMQIEQQRLCYKIALGENETGLNNSETDINAIQDYVFNFLITFAKKQGETFIKRPNQFVHRGNYRTLAVIDLPNWCGDPEQIVDKQEVLKRLSDIITFYQQFMKELNKVSFETAGIKIMNYNKNEALSM
jgi:hypothetical protein